MNLLITFQKRGVFIRTFFFRTFFSFADEDEGENSFFCFIVCYLVTSINYPPVKYSLVAARNMTNKRKKEIINQRDDWNYNQKKP